MANERFSIIEHMSWTHGKVSMYGSLQPILVGGKVYDKVLVDTTGLESIDGVMRERYPVRAVENTAYTVPHDPNSGTYTVREIYEWDPDSNEIADDDDVIQPSDVEDGNPGRWIKANDKYLFAYDFDRLSKMGSSSPNAETSLKADIFSTSKILLDICDQIWADADTAGTPLTDWPSITQLQPILNNYYQDDDKYGNNKTIRLYWEFISNLTDTNSVDSSNVVFEPHLALKKNQELGVYFSPLIDLRSPVKDLVNVFDKGTSNSEIYYRGVQSPPRLTPDFKVESDSIDAALLPDKYVWRPDTFMHPLEEGLVHTWPLHYEDTYLDDVQSGRHAEIPINTVLLRQRPTGTTISSQLVEWASSIKDVTNVDDLIKSVEVSPLFSDGVDVGKLLNGTYTPTVGIQTCNEAHIPYFHWYYPKTMTSSDKLDFDTTLAGTAFKVNDTLNPFNKDSSAVNLDTYIPSPQEFNDLLIKMHDPFAPDLNGHLLNYYDDFGDNRNQYIIFNDVFKEYPDQSLGYNGLDLISKVEDGDSYYLDGSDQIILSTSMPLPNTFNNSSTTKHYLSVLKTNLKKYMPYLFSKFATEELTSSKIFDSAPDNSTFVIPKRLVRASTAKLATDLFPKTRSSKAFGCFHNFYEDDKLTGYLNIGSFEGDPLSTGDGNLSFAFSLRNISGGSIISTGAEITNETGIYAELTQKENDHEHPIDPFNWGLNVIVKSKNYKYELNDLNFYNSTDENSEIYQEYKRLGFGIFRPIPSMQRSAHLNYTSTPSSNLGVSHVLKEIYDLKNSPAGASFVTFNDGTSSTDYYFGDYFNYSGNTATLKEEWTKSYMPQLSNDSYILSINTTNNPSISKFNITKWLDYKDWAWTNILVTKKEEIEYVKVPNDNTKDILDYELLLDDEGNPITNYLDAKIWLLNHIEDAIDELGDWNGDITVRPKTNETHDAYDTNVVNRMDVYASYKHDNRFEGHDDVDYVLLGSVNGSIANYSEGDNTTLYLGRANDSSKPYFMGHLKDVGVWYKYMDIIDTMVNNLTNTRSIIKMVTSSKSIVTDETTIRGVLTDPTNSSSKPYYLIKHYNDGTTDYVVTDTGNVQLSTATLDDVAILKLDNESIFTHVGGVKFSDMIDVIRYTDVQYTIDYSRSQYLSDLALNVKTTKWTKYPFLISYNPPTPPLFQNGPANLDWYNRSKSNFGSVTYPKEKILENKGYRGWQSKILLKL